MNYDINTSAVESDPRTVMAFGSIVLMFVDMSIGRKVKG